MKAMIRAGFIRQSLAQQGLRGRVAQLQPLDLKITLNGRGTSSRPWKKRARR